MDKKPRHSTKSSETEAKVVGFLDSHFSGHRVQHDPTCGDKAMLFSTWRRLYDETYKDHCRASQIAVGSYDRFCAIRHSQRPSYKIAKTFRRKSGWNHMACDLCDNFKRAIEDSNCREEKKSMQVFCLGICTTYILFLHFYISLYIGRV